MSALAATAPGALAAVRERAAAADAATQADPADAGRASNDPAESVALRAMLDLLDHERREAFVLTQLVGLSYAEAADVCSCPVGTIRSRVARARADLVDAFGGRRQRSASS